MSRLGKISLVLAGVALMVGGAFRAALGQWETQLWVPVALFFVFLVVAIFKDFSFYKEFAAMKTTKHGLNMGTLIVLVLILLGAVNFVAFKNNKKWDLSEEKLNSLSAQSIQVVKKLDSPLEVRGFYQEGGPDDERMRNQFRAATHLYEDETPNFKASIVNPLKSPDIAKKFKVDALNTVVLSYKGKQTTITEITEESITNAIVKLSRDKNKIVYFLKGHGELDLGSESPSGGARFKKSLEDSSYEVRPLNLVETQTIPADADVLAVIGPTQALLAPELTAIENYLRKGGHLFLAMDPGKKHNLGDLTKKIGVKFDNVYIVDKVGQMVGASAALAIGMVYSKTSDITKNFGENMMTAFQLASSLDKSNPPQGIAIDDIVKSSPASFSKADITGEVKLKEGDRRGPLTIGMQVKGKIPAEGKNPGGDVEFSSTVFGDSDFLTNQLLDMQLNRDLALNSFSYLAKDQDLISIRPKEPKGTRMVMTNTQAALVAFGLYIPIPLLLFFAGAFVWFRRRGA